MTKNYLNLIKIISDIFLVVRCNQSLIKPLYFLNTGENNANVHKWLAVVLYEKTEHESTEARIKAYTEIKRHLRRAAELQPDDVVVLHILGKLCFELAHLTPFQRMLAKTFYAQPPDSTYEEAYQYFEKAESIRPRFYLPNLYMLGRTCFELKQYFRANYYLNIAANLPAITEYERWCAKRSKQIAEALKEFDVTQDAVFLQMPSDNWCVYRSLWICAFVCLVLH